MTESAENDAPLDEWDWCTDHCPEDCEADHKGEE